MRTENEDDYEQQEEDVEEEEEEHGRKGSYCLQRKGKFALNCVVLKALASRAPSRLLGDLHIPGHPTP